MSSAASSWTVWWTVRFTRALLLTDPVRTESLVHTPTAGNIRPSLHRSECRDSCKLYGAEKEILHSLEKFAGVHPDRQRPKSSHPPIRSFNVAGSYCEGGVQRPQRYEDKDKNDLFKETLSYVIDETFVFVSTLVHFKLVSYCPSSCEDSLIVVVSIKQSDLHMSCSMQGDKAVLNLEVSRTCPTRWVAAWVCEALITEVLPCAFPSMLCIIFYDF